jgi:hypothetical protein
MAGARDQGTGVASTVFGSAFDSGVFDDVFYARDRQLTRFSGFLLKPIKLIILGKHISSNWQKFAIKMPKDPAHEFT